MNTIDEHIFNDPQDQKELNTQQDKQLEHRIRRLVTQQSFCILSTQGNEQPYGSLIAYAFSDDLKQYFFSTQLATRKYRLLQGCDHVALVIDNRCQHLDNMMQVEAVTITGNAKHINSGANYKTGLKHFRDRHPYLNDFLESPSTALFQIDVVRYFHVTRFQMVSQWIP